MPDKKMDEKHSWVWCHDNVPEWGIPRAIGRIGIRPCIEQNLNNVLPHNSCGEVEGGPLFSAGRNIHNRTVVNQELDHLWIGIFGRNRQVE